MHYLITNFEQSGRDLMKVLFFSPIISVGLSVVVLVVFLGFLKSENTSIQRRMLNYFISSYVVCICWGWIFIFCAIFISPIQIFKIHTGESVKSTKYLDVQNWRMIKQPSPKTNEISIAFENSEQK